jgi:hypothetical protein
MMRFGSRILLGSLLLAAGAVWGHDVAADAGDLTLTAHEFTRYLHVVLLVFWLGPDVGIMVAGAYATNAGLNPAQRAGAARMMQYYEIMPRVCMSLMLTVGGILSEQVGLEHPLWQMAGIYLLGPLWLALTLVAYFGNSAGAGALAAKLEQWLRIALIIGVPVSVAYSIATGRLTEAPYIGSKLILFALVLLLGLLARRAFAPFLDGVRQLPVQGASPAIDQSMVASFGRGRRLVFATWVALLVAALIGIVQPGMPEEPGPMVSSIRSPTAL